MAKQKTNPAQSLGMSINQQSLGSNTSAQPVKFQGGFDFINTGAGGVARVTKTITFPTAFTTILGITVTSVGQKTGSDPTDLTNFTTTFTGGLAEASGISLSSFVANISTNSGGSFGASERWGFSWIAWGII